MSTVIKVSIECTVDLVGSTEEAIIDNIKDTLSRAIAYGSITNRTPAELISFKVNDSEFMSITQ